MKPKKQDKPQSYYSARALLSELYGVSDEGLEDAPMQDLESRFKKALED